MTNPFDLYEDTHEDWDKNFSVELSDFDYNILLNDVLPVLKDCSLTLATPHFVRSWVSVKRRIS